MLFPHFLVKDREARSSRAKIQTHLYATAELGFLFAVHTAMSYFAAFIVSVNDNGLMKAGYFSQR